MSLSFLSNTTFNLTNAPIIKLSTSTIVTDDNIWNDIKLFFNLQNSLIIVIIICIILFFFTLCFVFIIIKLLKKKRSYKTQADHYSNMYFPFQTKNFSSPIQQGLTSNQIASHENITSSLTMNNKDMTISPLLKNEDEIETVNEVLAMEERNGKIYYKVNFTGHSPDYIAWVCEDDLIPE